MKFNKIRFIDEVRRLSHLEPSSELWNEMWAVYNLYANKTVESVLEDRLLLNSQKEKYDEIERFREEYKRRIEEMYGGSEK